MCLSLCDKQLIFFHLFRASAANYQQTNEIETTCCYNSETHTKEAVLFFFFLREVLEASNRDVLPAIKHKMHS